MRLKKDEYLRLTVLPDKGDSVLDIHVWKRSPTGGYPTNKTITVDKRFIVPLIRGLQKVHREQSSLEAHTTEVTQG
jgi:hypothetical protein